MVLNEKFQIFPDDICDYFGVQIALYFAWLGHYTKALLIPAFVGCMFWVRFKPIKFKNILEFLQLQNPLMQFYKLD